jgi:hypothetical protein
MKGNQRVLLVSDLAGFTREIPPEMRDQIYDPTKVHLNLTEKLAFTGKYHIPQKDIFLNLQGVNSAGEIVWLMDRWTVSIRPGGEGEPAWVPWSPGEQSLYGCLRNVHRLVNEHLTRLGYDVRDGQYGIPKGIEPVRGMFECIRWIKLDDTYRVELVDSTREKHCVCGHPQAEHESGFGPCHIQGCPCADYQEA